MPTWPFVTVRFSGDMLLPVNDQAHADKIAERVVGIVTQLIESKLIDSFIDGKLSDLIESNYDNYDTEDAINDKVNESLNVEVEVSEAHDHEIGG